MFEHKVKTSMFTTPIQYYIRNSTQGNKAIIRKKRITEWRGRNKTVPIYREHDGQWKILRNLQKTL